MMLYLYITLHTKPHYTAYRVTLLPPHARLNPRLHCRYIPYLYMLYMLRTPYIVTSHCTSRHISLHTKSHRTAHRTAYIDSHCTDRHIALHTQSHRAAHTVTPHCIHRHLSAYILTSRGGGLGSRPIFKKFNEPYAPS